MDIYSSWSNIHKFNFPNQPNISFSTLEFNETLDGITFDVTTYNNPQNIVEYQEVFYSYGESPIGLFPNYPYLLLYKNYTLDGEFNIPFSIPEPIFDEDREMLNEYIYVKLRAYSPIQRSICSSVQAQILPPNACTNLAFTLDDYYLNYINLTWTRNSGKDTDYYVYLKKPGGEYNSEHKFTNGEEEFALFLDNDPEGEYAIKIVAENDSGIAESDELLFTPFRIALDSRLELENGTLLEVFTFNDIPDAGFSYVELYRNDEYISTISSSQGYILDTISEEGTYEWYLKAYDSEDNLITRTVNSIIDTVTSSDLDGDTGGGEGEAVDTPPVLSLNSIDNGGGNHTEQLSWTLNEYSTGTKIYKSTNGTDFSLLIDLSSGEEYYEDEVDGAGTYYYKIKSYSNYFESDYSNTVQDTVVIDPIGQPFGLVMTQDSPALYAWAYLNWYYNAPPTNNYFDVEWMKVGATSWSVKSPSVKLPSVEVYKRYNTEMFGRGSGVYRYRIKCRTTPYVYSDVLAVQVVFVSAGANSKYTIVDQWYE